MAGVFAFVTVIGVALAALVVAMLSVDAVIRPVPLHSLHTASWTVPVSPRPLHWGQVSWVDMGGGYANTAFVPKLPTQLRVTSLKPRSKIDVTDVWISFVL